MITNIFYPGDEIDDVEQDEIDDFIDENEDDLSRAYNRARGSLEYQSTMDHNQEWNLNLVNAYDANIVMNMLFKPDDIDVNRLPAGYDRTYRLLTSPNIQQENRNGIYQLFQDKLDLFFDQDVVDVDGQDKVRNPVTGKMIKYKGSTYKNIFKKIRLEDVRFDTQYIFNTVDYKIKDYCVPSFFRNDLGKKKWNGIKHQFKENPTPTYPELTKMLNIINIGLNVLIADGEKLQQQKFKKVYSIMIHNNHMYVLKQTKYVKHKVKYLKYKEYNQKKNELRKRNKTS